MESEILLIDEILGVGDMAFQKKCHAMLDELRAKGLTFLIVSHSPGVERYCKRAIWIERGEADRRRRNGRNFPPLYRNDEQKPELQIMQPAIAGELPRLIL